MSGAVWRDWLKARIVRSPIDGVVMARTLGPGEYAFDQGHLVTVAEIDPLYVEVYVPLQQFGRIRMGMAAEVGNALRAQEPLDDFGDRF